MKKVLLVAVAGLFVFASCKKDYECSCTYTDSNGNEESTSQDYTGLKKSQAESLQTQCEASASCTWSEK